MREKNPKEDSSPVHNFKPGDMVWWYQRTFNDRIVDHGTGIITEYGPQAGTFYVLKSCSGQISCFPWRDLEDLYD